jgi:protein gp37
MLAHVPFPAQNVFHGISVTDQGEAEAAAPFLNQMRATFPTMKLAVSQGPDLDVIKWHETDLLPNAVDWFMWEGESGDTGSEDHAPRTAHIDSWLHLRTFGETHKIPVFFKQAGTVLAKKHGLSGKGDEISELPAEWGAVQQAPDISTMIVK